MMFTIRCFMKKGVEKIVNENNINISQGETWKR